MIILEKKEEELKNIKKEIKKLEKKLSSTKISSNDKFLDSIKEIKKKIALSDISSNHNILDSIKELEKNLDKEIEKLNDVKYNTEYKVLTPVKKVSNDKKNTSLIEFLKQKKKLYLSDRIKFYYIINKYIERIKDKINCFGIYKASDDEYKKYKIGSKIILDKKIGDDSKYGITFISHFKSESNNELDQYLIFATKLTDLSRKGNLIEYQILEYLTKLNINEVCPNFPIGYGKLECSKYQNREFDEREQLPQSYIKRNKKEVLGTELYDINQIYIFNEIADGSLRQIKKLGKSNEVIINALEQCIMSIIFFNKYINAYHNDCHYGNFLYHNIESGGYFHYNIYGNDYYIENIGYLWVIWDYGLITPYYNSYEINKEQFGPSSIHKLLSIATDYTRLFDSIKSIFDGQNYNLTYVISKHLNNYYYVNDLDNIKNFTIELLELLVIYSNTIRKSIDSNYSKIINKKPYIVK